MFVGLSESSQTAAAKKNNSKHYNPKHSIDIIISVCHLCALDGSIQLDMGA